MTLAMSYQQNSDSNDEARLRNMCERMLELKIIACGTDDGDFFITLEDGSDIVFWAEDDNLSMNIYNADRGMIN